MYIRGLIINNPCVDSRPEDVKKKEKKRKQRKSRMKKRRSFTFLEDRYLYKYLLVQVAN